MNQHDPSPVEPPVTSPRLQFGLKGLLVGLTVFSALCALASYGAVPGALGVAALLASGLFFRRTRPICGVLGTLFLAIMFLLPAVTNPRWSTRRYQCINNLKTIGLALQNYHTAYGSFPPAYIADANGKPIHSWRVLILPFADHAALYDLYSFDEPWDGPNNSQLANEFPSYLECPESGRGRAPFTNYVAVVGAETAWPGDKTVSAADITDGLNGTIQVVEIAGSNIHWMEPRDLDIGAVNRGVNPTAGTGISSSHPGGSGGGSNALFADGSVRFLSNDQALPLYRLFTIQGGETVDLK